MASECANPLLLGWLKEWFDVARERNSKGAAIYKKAYDSMKACPVVFNHPTEAQQLHGLGPKLCDRLTEKLKAHCDENGLPMPEAPHKARKRQSQHDGDPAPAKKTRKAKPYIPTLRSGPYALVLALSTLSENSSNGLSKTQVIELAQPDCDSSFTAPSDPTKFYTAWNSMKILLDKDLVYERGRPLRKYALTEEGWEVAKRINGTLTSDRKVVNDGPATEPSDKVSLQKDDGFRRVLDLEDKSEEDEERLEHSSLSRNRLARPKPVHCRQNDDGFLELLSSPVASKPAGQGKFDTPASHKQQPSEPKSAIDTAVPTSFESVRIPPGTFTVQLVIDNREVRAKTDRDYIQEELSKKGIPTSVRALGLGDALWIAKCKDPHLLSRHGEEGDEIMLDWIVERKRLDDLVGSIKDGRFHEQKFRLAKSGVKNVVYVIEEISLSTEIATKYHEAVESAIASTQVVNGYFVKKTQKLDDTIRYLARMTVLLKNLYEPKPLILIPSSTLHPQTYLPLMNHLRTTQPLASHNITFPSFSSLASKSDSLNLRDVFLKMLMCTRGVTGEKALEIQRTWKTPREFIAALAERPEGKSREEMVFEVAGGKVGRRKIGKALSGKIADVWA